MEYNDYWGPKSDIKTTGAVKACRYLNIQVNDRKGVLASRLQPYYGRKCLV